MKIFLQKSQDNVKQMCYEILLHRVLDMQARGQTKECSPTDCLLPLIVRRAYCIQSFCRCFAETSWIVLDLEVA